MSRSTTLGELLTATGGSIKTGPFGTTLKAAEYSSLGVPLISVGEVGYGTIRLTVKTPRVDTQVTNRLPEYILRHGDLVFGRKGAVDRSAWVRQHEDGFFLGSDGIRVRFGSNTDSRFMAYQLQSPDAREWLLQHASGTTMRSLNQKILERVPIVVPEYGTQQAIAEVLGALDDKIAANDKVASATKKLLSAEFARLRVDETAERIMVSDLVALNPRMRTPLAHEQVYLDMKNLPDQAMTVTSWSQRSPRGGARFQNGDTLLARITPCLENGKVGYVDFLGNGEIGIGSTEFIVMRARNDIPPAFPYFLSISQRFREFAIRHMVGSSGRQRLSAADLATFQVRRPNSQELHRFASVSDALMKRVKAVVDESRVLRKARDELLPLLMSGKVRVRDAEKVVEEVV